MSDGARIDNGRRLFTWSMAKRRSPHNELVDEIIASGAKLYNLNGKLVTPNKTGKATPVDLSHLQFIIAENITTPSTTLEDCNAVLGSPNLTASDRATALHQRALVYERIPDDNAALADYDALIQLPDAPAFQSPPPTSAARCCSKKSAAKNRPSKNSRKPWKCRRPNWKCALRPDSLAESFIELTEI